MATTVVLFDPEIVKVFVRKVAPYPVGMCVKLSDGKVGIVVENRESLCMGPKIRIFKENGHFPGKPYIVDLADHEKLNVAVMAVV